MSLLMTDHHVYNSVTVDVCNDGNDVQVGIFFLPSSWASVDGRISLIALWSG